MSVVYCENCGAECKSDQDFCHKCSGSLIGAADERFCEINGIPIGRLHVLIDRNAGRYIEIFADNENKTHFLTFNWAAFFFPELWLLYRRMFSYAFLKIVLSFLLTIAVIFVCYLSFLPQINEIKAMPDFPAPPSTEHLQEYDDWVIDSYVEEYTRRNSKEAKLNIIYEMIGGFTLLFNLLFNFVFSLYSDCIYRHYILKHTTGPGGVSFVAVIIALAPVGILVFAHVIGFGFDTLSRIFG